MNSLTRTKVEPMIRSPLRKYHAEHALLFGSYVHDEATANSDIDVFVAGGKMFRAKDIFAFGEELRQMTGKNVDAFELREVNKDTPFYDAVMSKGVRIA